ncbi:MAG: mucoidy inhibitor MuiA family protein [Paludibacteraceae bacterium]|nr:mucoidy inhibitor MuiA family protein [Paludibacteraceae bacterium]
MACLTMQGVMADTLTINTDIEKVTVYKQGALVSRKTHVKVPAGVTTYKLTMLSPVLDKKSLQVGVTNADITLGKVDVDIEMLNRTDIAQKNDSLKRISSQIADSIKLIDSYYSVLEQEKSILLRNDNVGGKKGFDAEQLSGIAAFLRKDLDEIVDMQLAYNQRRKALELEQQNIGQEMLLLDERAMTPNGIAYVTLIASAAAETDLEVQYRVKDAEWTPFFELRIAKDKPSMEVTKKVMVLQKSKEEWKDVKLTVTRTDPSDNNARPELKVYTLPKSKYTSSQSGVKTKEMVKVMGNVRDEKGSIDGVLVTCLATNTTTQTDASGFYEILAPVDSRLRFTHATHSPEEIVVRSSSLVENVVMQENASLIYGNSILIKGHVRDSEDVLPGANITIKGTTEGTTSDMDGYFELTVPVGSTVEFSYIGYMTKRLKITKDTKANLDIRLQIDDSLMEEVVVVGYGRQSLKNRIGNALKSRVSGLKVSSASELAGQPGVASTVKVRGTSSLTGNADPLYVVDGEPIVALGANPLGDLDPADIVSMEVVKGPSAVAIYGSRAKNGVVLVTTRNGKVGTDLYLSLFSKLQEYTAEATALNTIPSDGSEHEATLETVTIPVEYDYYAVPKMTSNVYMIAEVKARDYDLLPGELRVFLDNTYIGKSYWKPNGLNDIMDFSVGVEKDVAVERTLKSNLNDLQKSLLKFNNKISLTWQIVVKNNKEVPVEVNVEEQIPVSTQKDVKVELLESSNATVDELLGRLYWHLQLAPGEKKILPYRYEIKARDADDLEELLDDVKLY